MAVGKNKKLGKKGKIAGKKKAADPFTRKEWYDIKAPSLYNVRVAGKTPVTRTGGTHVASESLKGRVFTVSQADLQGNEADDFRKVKLIGEEVQGKALLTTFYGMDMTRDKLNGLIRKWQTLIEASVDVQTTDGYKLRLFCIAFTKRRPNQIKKTSYAKASQIRAIRKKMVRGRARRAAPRRAAPRCPRAPATVWLRPVCCGQDSSNARSAPAPAVNSSAR